MKTTALFFLFVMFCIQIFSQTLPDILTENASPAHSYYANQGQLVDQNGNAVPDILYATQHASPALFLAQNKIHFALPVIDTADTNMFRLDMTFCGYPENFGEGSETACEPNVVASEMTDNVINYYYDHCPDGILNVPGYERIKYENVYSGIDIELYSNEAGLKAYIVIHPTANPNDIIFFFEGQDSLEVDTSGWLEMFFSSGSIDFPQATAYQIDGGNNPYALTWLPLWNDMGGGYVGMTMGSYNPSERLVIRLAGPVSTVSSSNNNLNWSTYFGTSGREEARDIENEPGTSGYFYVLMSSFFTGNGVYISQKGLVSFKGNHDVHLTKFLSNRTVDWETFYGGLNDDLAQEMEFSNLNSNIYVTGVWQRLVAGGLIPFPTTNNGTYKKVNESSNTESFVVSFNQDGSVDWVTYFGGTGSDLVQALEVNNKEGILFITGSTSSSSTLSSCSHATSSGSNFPVCNAVGAGYFQQSFGGGDKDGFLAAFDVSDNSLIYSSFFGGNGDDVIRDVVTYGYTEGDTQGQQDTYVPLVYLCGFTSTQDIEETFPSPRSALTTGSFPLSDPGSGAYFQSVNNSVKNGFIAFMENWDLTWNTYIGGDEEDDMLNLQFGKNDHIYMVGKTNSSATSGSNCSYNSGNKIPICNSNSISYTESSNGDDLYICRFNDNHEMIWGTSFGHDDSHEQFEFGIDIELDENENIYIVGNTKNLNTTSKLNYTLPAYNTYNQTQNLPSPGNNSDGYLLMFNSDNEMIWSTYFGGDKNEVLFGTEYKDNKLRISGASESFSSNNTANSRTFPLEDPGSGSYFQSDAKSTTFPLNGTITEFSLSQPFLNGFKEKSYTPELGIRLYPNPAKDILHIEVNSQLTYKEKVVIYNIQGSIVYSYTLKMKAGLNYISIDISNLESGMFLLRIGETESNKLKSLTFIKTN